MQGPSDRIARAWLPPAAFDAASLAGPLVAPLERWSTRWLARDPGWSVSNGILTSNFRAGKNEGWEAVARGLWWRVTGAGRDALVRLILDAPIQTSRSSSADQTLIERFMGGALDDLRQEFAQLAGGLRAPTDEGGPVRIFALDAANGSARIDIALDAERVVAIRKRACDPAPPRALRPLATGLARQEVAIAAHLGTSRLSLADFADLTPGDVLLLDGDVSGPVPLTVGGSGPLGTCIIEPDGPGYRLKIVETFRNS